MKSKREIINTGSTVQSTVLLGLRKVKDIEKVVKVSCDEKVLSGKTANRYLLAMVTLVAWYVFAPIVMFTTPGMVI